MNGFVSVEQVLPKGIFPEGRCLDGRIMRDNEMTVEHELSLGVRPVKKQAEPEQDQYLSRFGHLFLSRGNVFQTSPNLLGKAGIVAAATFIYGGSSTSPLA